MIYGKYKTTNCNPDEEEKMSLDWSYPKETHWIHRVGARLEPPGARRRGCSKKTWRKTVEEEATEVGKTWSEVGRIAVNWMQWKRFTDALCSRGSDRNLLLLQQYQKNVLSTDMEFLVYTVGFRLYVFLFLLRSSLLSSSPNHHRE
jgi:hypothetical protein